jgi:uncharacterized membrane protein
MNTAIRTLTSSKKEGVISSPEDALDCLKTLRSNFNETKIELTSLGLLFDATDFSQRLCRP